MIWLMEFQVQEETGKLRDIFNPLNALRDIFNAGNIFKCIQAVFPQQKLTEIYQA